MYVCTMCLCATVHMRRSEDNFYQPVLSFHHRLQDLNSGVRLAGPSHQPFFPEIGSYISHDVTSQNCYKEKQANTYKANSIAPQQRAE